MNSPLCNMGKEAGDFIDVSCAAKNCTNNQTDCEDVSFFHFPEDPDRSKIWVDSCNRIDLIDKDAVFLNANYYVCGMHFKDSMFICSLKNELINEAIPTIFNLDYDTDPAEQIDESLKEEIEDENPTNKEEINLEEGNMQKVDVENYEDLYGSLDPTALLPKIEIYVENTKFKEEIVGELYQEFHSGDTVNIRTGSVEIEKVFIEMMDMDCEPNTDGAIDPLGDDNPMKCSDSGGGDVDSLGPYSKLGSANTGEDPGKVVKLLLMPPLVMAKCQENSCKMDNKGANSERKRKASSEICTENPSILQPITDKNNRNKFSNKINSEYECQICNFKTPYKTIRDRHAGLHLDGMLYKCLLCGLRADTSEKLREHMLSVHTSSVKRYRCDMCTYKACSELSVIKHKSLVHQTVHHETTDLLLRQECLWRPVVSADGERTYPCKLCDFIGTRSTYLLNHMSVHRERKHPCSY
ncbi:uncharacterized protein isoform X2 [Rhodnius prolixus]|uniref:uncharacterized protein isoform X2 n=1 Tax=Rhodnius prolixus TaxID=13249 RepID=UPI003D18CC51